MRRKALATARQAKARRRARAAASSSPKSSPRSIAARRRTRSWSVCAPAARRRRRSTGAWRCWPSTPATTKEAQQRFTELLSSGEGNDAVQLYLADIAARDGDPDAALAGLPAPVRLVAWHCRRARGPRRCCSSGSSRTEALALLDDYAADHPEDELDLTLAKARLLADHGEADTGLAIAQCGARAPSAASLDRVRPRGDPRAGRARERVGRGAASTCWRSDPTIRRC